MDYLKTALGQKSNPTTTSTSSTSNTSTSNTSNTSGGGIGDKLHGMLGGGPHSEKDEDMLDKGVDFAQERVLGQGSQDNESAIEQAKDEQISDAIRRGYKSVTGGEVPIADK